jgi:uncharacterized protein DUF4180
MAADALTEVAETAVLACAPDGPRIASEADVTELIGAAMGQGAEVVLIPVERLDPSFFTLRTGLAGSLMQKLVNYRMRGAVVGDISGYVEASIALRDLVRESNRGRQFWFVASADDLADRLTRGALPS